MLCRRGGPSRRPAAHGCPLGPACSLTLLLSLLRTVARVAGLWSAPFAMVMRPWRAIGPAMPGRHSGYLPALGLVGRCGAYVWAGLRWASAPCTQRANASWDDCALLLWLLELAHRSRRCSSHPTCAKINKCASASERKVVSPGGESLLPTSASYRTCFGRLLIVLVRALARRWGSCAGALVGTMGSSPASRQAKRFADLTRFVV